MEKEKEKRILKSWERTIETAFPTAKAIRIVVNHLYLTKAQVIMKINIEWLSMIFYSIVSMINIRSQTEKHTTQSPFLLVDIPNRILFSFSSRISS